MEHVMIYPSPVGELTGVERDGFVTALVLAGQRYADGLVPAGIAPCATGEEPEALAKVRAWLDAYFAGRRPGTDGLPLAPQGSAYRQRVWQELLTIPYGSTVSYGGIAERIGSTPRAVGGAVGHNPLLILIPCHRVLGANGSMTGYAGGIPNKRWLLEFEAKR